MKRAKMVINDQPLMLLLFPPCSSLLLLLCFAFRPSFHYRISWKEKEKRAKNMMFLPVISAHDVSLAQSGWRVVRENKQHSQHALYFHCFARSKIIPPQNPLPHLSLTGKYPSHHSVVNKCWIWFSLKQMHVFVLRTRASLIPSSSRGLSFYRFICRGFPPPCLSVCFVSSPLLPDSLLWDPVAQHK